MDNKSEPGSSDWKKEVFKIGAVVAATLVTLTFISSDVSVWTMIFGVIMIATVSWLVERKSEVNRISMRNKAVLVTGCDTGFGHELAISLSIQGATVYAGCLNKYSDGAQALKDKGSASRLHVLQMDVTSMEDVEDARTYIEKDLASRGFRGLWAVVNNAGLNFLGDIELTTMEQFERVNNINYLGVVRVTKCFIPLVRTAKGRFTIVTSVKGLFSESFNGAYGPTKYAGEAFTDILRLEMKKFDVKVSAIEPCQFAACTDVVNKDRIGKDFDTMWHDLSPDQQSLYGNNYFATHLKSVEDAIPLGSTQAFLVVDAIEDALFNETPKTRYLVPGGSGWIDVYRWRAYVKPFLPDWLMDRWLLRDTQHFPTVHT